MHWEARATYQTPREVDLGSGFLVVAVVRTEREHELEVDEILQGGAGPGGQEGGVGHPTSVVGGEGDVPRVGDVDAREQHVQCLGGNLAQVVVVSDLERMDMTRRREEEERRNRAIEFPQGRPSPVLCLLALVLASKLIQVVWGRQVVTVDPMHHLEDP